MNESDDAIEPKLVALAIARAAVAEDHVALRALLWESDPRDARVILALASLSASMAELAFGYDDALANLRRWTELTVQNEARE